MIAGSVEGVSPDHPRQTNRFARAARENWSSLTAVSLEVIDHARQSDTGSEEISVSIRFPPPAVNWLFR